MTCLSLVLLASGGCAIIPTASSRSRDNDRTEASLPRLDEIRSRVTPVEPPEVDEPAPARRVSATIRQVELPLHTNLDDSWTLPNENVLGERARSVWNANGVRAGLLPLGEADDFFEDLPYVVNVRQARLISGRKPSTLRTSPPLRKPVRIDLTGVEQADADETVVELERGRMRLLVDMTPNAAGGVTVTLLPHHQLRHLTLQPRDPLEKQMDGRVFEELAVSFDMDRDDVLVLGLYWPWVDADEDEAEADERGESGGSLDAALEQIRKKETVLPWEMDESDAPELAHHFGRAVFASRRAGGPLQHVVLMHVEPTGGERPQQTQPSPTPAN